MLWEGQFGDFANGAQVIIDQFIVSGLAKWGQSSRLTLLLPHAYEGSGPEHSSARLERFLQLAAEGNIRVAYPTTPAQYFHLLRRQAKIAKQRPLIVMTPKSLLRLPQATNRIEHLVGHAVLPGAGGAAGRRAAGHAPDPLHRQGLLRPRRQRPRARTSRSVAIGRVELLYPFPQAQILEAGRQVPEPRERSCWLQEEPRNMGARAHMSPRLLQILPREHRTSATSADPSGASTARGLPGRARRRAARASSRPRSTSTGRSGCTRSSCRASGAGYAPLPARAAARPTARARRARGPGPRRAARNRPRR